MKRYSIAPGLTRKSQMGSGSDPATLELEKLDQEITLTLQEIDKNLLKANAVISEKMFPILARYSQSSQKVWNNANFWKYFLEQSADVELTSYEAPANLGTNLNTLANSKRADNDAVVDNTSKTTEWPEKELSDREDNHVHRLDVGEKRRTFAGLENTPLWSPPRRASNMHASTPEGTRNAPAADPGNSVAQPTPQLTHTIRQSLDNYQRISISPRKETRAASERRRRDSVIRNFINSSPTLPEPPVLVSDLGDAEWKQTHNVRSPTKGGASATPMREPAYAGQNSLQRFPRTPNLGADTKVDMMRTPLGVRLRYGDDSELAPPELETGRDRTAAARDASSADVPLPELQTVEGTSKRRRLSTADDEQNVFLDPSKRPSRDNTQNSHLLGAFEEAVTNSSLTLRNTKDAGQPQDLFATIEHDTTDNSTSELGQFYRDRLKEFTNYGS